MQPRSVFLEIGRSAPSPLFEAWAASLVASGTESLRISSFEDLEGMTPRAGDFLVLPWSAAEVPEYVVERVSHDPQWIRLPLLVVLETMEPEVREFLREYSVPYLINGRDLTKATVEIARCVAQDRVQAEPTEPRFLHLLGAVAFKRLDHAQARDFLEAAHKVSPLNLRRRQMLGQLYVEIGELDLALSHLRAVMERVPAYPGPHARAVEVLYALARRPGDLAPLDGWLEHVPTSKLPVITKRLDLNALKPLRSLFASKLFRTYLARARRAAELDDHYAALGLLEKAEGLARQAEAADLKDLFVAKAETALALGDVVLAEVAVAALLQGFTGAPEALPLQERLSRLKARQRKSAS